MLLLSNLGTVLPARHNSYDFELSLFPATTSACVLLPASLISKLPPSFAALN